MYSEIHNGVHMSHGTVTRDKKEKGAMGRYYKVQVKDTDCVEDRGLGSTQEGFGSNCPDFLPHTGSYFG